MSTADYYIKKIILIILVKTTTTKKEGCGLKKKITTNGEFLPKQTNSTIVFVNKQLISLDNILYREEEKFKRGSFFINICAAVFTIFVPCHH